MRIAREKQRYFVAGSTLTLSPSIHSGAKILTVELAGTVITLPSADAGIIGTKFTIVSKVAPTSVSDIVKVANATDVMVGGATVAATAGGTRFPTAATSDTITQNRTTTGGATRGGVIELECIAAGLWLVAANLNGSGTVADPFSATVS